MLRALPFALACVACAAPGEQTAPTRFEESRPAMGTEFRVVLYAEQAEDAERALTAAFARIEEIEQVFSDYREDSEVTRLVEAARVAEPGTWFPVSQDLGGVLELSLEIARTTEGAFDPTLGRLTRLWRRSQRQGALPTPSRLEDARAASGYTKIELRRSPPSVRFLAPGLELDFGGIAKGYALDEALVELQEHGIRSALIDGGGDLAMSEAPPDQPAGWRIVHPQRGSPDQSLELRNCAIATSGDRYQFVTIDGVTYSHLIDPTTGLGMTRPSEATVQSGLAVMADALASAACVGNDEAIDQALQRFGGMLSKTSGGPFATQPNILFILADDLGWADLGCQGSTSYRTPAIDSLATDGIRFTHAYAAAANCAPTRATLMTGQSIPVHGMYTVGSGARGKKENRSLVPPPNVTTIPGEVVTLAESLQAAGYRTGHFGKWHLGGVDTPEGPRAQGFDVNIGGDHVGHPPTYFWPYRRENKDGEITRQLPQLEDGAPGEYLSDRLTDEALAFLDADDPRPWFLYFPHYAVHTPIQAPEDAVQEAQDRSLTGRQVDPTYTAMVENLDHNVGRLLAWLEQHDQAHNTIVIFSSDNGGFGGYLDAGVDQRDITHNHPLKGGKGMMSEGGLRVPLLVRWPASIEGGQVSPTPVHTLDYYPTLLAAAGAPAPPQTLEGQDLTPLWSTRVDTMEGSAPHFAERALYFHMPGYLEARRGSWRATPAGAIRRGPWKLIEPFDDRPIELYHLTQDPGESKNLANDETAIRDALLDELQEWRNARQAPMPQRKD